MTEVDGVLWGPPTIQFENNPVIVGRISKDQGGSFPKVNLRHPRVSRRHAKILIVDGGWLVYDLGSRAGTRVNGKRIEQALLNEGDRVEFGPVAYEFRERLLWIIPERFHVTAKELAIDRGGQRILSRVNLTLRPNQFIGILGPSGAGKTTLIKCLAGFTAPAAGDLQFDGRDLFAAAESYRSYVGYVPQEDVVYGLLTVRENLMYAASLRLASDLQDHERSQIVEGVLERFDLAKHADKPASILSGGERKRLNTAVELVSQPRIVFLDEPTSGLDPAAETELMQLLKNTAAKGVTVVCSTHVMANLGLFDQVIVVAEETVAYSGPPEEVLAHFKASNYPDLYRILKKRTACKQLAPTRDDVSKPTPEKPSGWGPPQQMSMSSVSRIPMSNQITVQLLRGMQLIFRDRWLLLLLVFQPLLIGLLINLSQIRPTKLAPIFAFAVVGCAWLGLSNTAREVIRDRSVYLRERLIGVSPEGYLAAKIILYAGVGLVQTFLLLVMVRYLTFLSGDDKADLAKWSPVLMHAVFWMTYLCAALLGLLVSTLANSQEVAVATLPILVLPQLLFTGVATGLDSDRDGSFRSIVVLMHRLGESSRGFMGWLLELLSMTMYSRPALCLLQRQTYDPRLPSTAVVIFVDWLHLLLLLIVTAAALLAVFHKIERRWLETL